jgi:hypothetical protein
MRAALWLLPLYLAMATALGFADFRMRAHQERAALEFIPAVVAGTAEAPERYRVLMPFAIDALAGGSRESLPIVWLAARLVSFVAACLALHWYLTSWYNNVGAVAGTAMTMALLPLTFTNSWAHPDHIAELALFTAASAALAREQFGLFLIVAVVAGLNRETAVFLVFLCAAASWGRPLWILRVGSSAAAFLVVYFALRIWRGWVHYDYWQFWRNIEFLKLLPEAYDPYYRAYAWFFIVAFVPLLVLAVRAGKNAPLFARRAMFVVPVFVGVAVTLSSIIETRIFTPLFTLMVPAAVAGLGRVTKENSLDPSL